MEIRGTLEKGFGDSRNLGERFWRQAGPWRQIMKIPIPRQEIRRILGGRYENLHREFLGIDISGRGVDPIDQNVYYVSYLDSTGWDMYWNDAPAMCDFRDGAIYCYHNPTLPLTEVRLVHEFVHRAARFRPSIGVWSSGVVVSKPWVKVNEGLTEYITSILLGPRYQELVSPDNRYLLYLPAIRRMEEKTGRQRLVQAYLDHDVNFFQDYVTPAGNSGIYRFR